MRTPYNGFQGLEKSNEEKFLTANGREYFYLAKAQRPPAVFAKGYAAPQQVGGLRSDWPRKTRKFTKMSRAIKIDFGKKQMGTVLTTNGH
jgi:hypothetical protein